MTAEKTITLKGRNFLTLKDFTSEEIAYFLDLAARLKAAKKKGQSMRFFEGKNIALIFEKTSTRTRCSFEVAAHDLGMGVTYLDPSGSQIGKKESIRDTARVLGRMYEGIEYRGYGQEIVEELAKYAGVPVWNGLTNEYHPTQMLADLLTIREHLGELKGVKLVYMGDARYNMGNSLMIACAKMGMHFTACTAKEYFPNEELVKQCQEYAKISGGTITLTEDVQDGVKDADVIYTDVWVSMGEPDEVWEERIRMLKPYQVNKRVMELAGEKAIFMHCLHHAAAHAAGRDEGRRHRTAVGQRGVAPVGEAALLPDHRLPQLLDACRVDGLVAGESHRIVTVGLRAQHAAQPRPPRCRVDAEFGAQFEVRMLGVGETDARAVGRHARRAECDLLADVEDRERPRVGLAFENLGVEAVADLIVRTGDLPCVGILREPGCRIVENIRNAGRTHFQGGIRRGADHREGRGVGASAAFRAEGDRPLPVDTHVALRRGQAHRRVAARQPDNGGENRCRHAVFHRVHAHFFCSGVKDTSLFRIVVRARTFQPLPHPGSRYRQAVVGRDGCLSM